MKPVVLLFSFWLCNVTMPSMIASLWRKTNDTNNSSSQVTSSPTPTATKPIPTDTPEPPTNTPIPPTDTPTPTPANTPTSTPTPTATATETLTPTPQSSTSTEIPPTKTLTPSPTTINLPTATPTVQIEAVEGKVIYHDGVFEDGIGKYQSGVTPWLDLLVRLGDNWYGSERETEDEIKALPLPEGYHWEVEGGFSSLPNGEAWWEGPATEGTARLIGDSNEVIVELPLQVMFFSVGGDDGGSGDGGGGGGSSGSSGGPSGGDGSGGNQ